MRKLPTKAQLAECLEQAANLIEEKGWATHTFVALNGAICMMQACYEACPEIYQESFALALGFRENKYAFSYNDTKGRTKEHVLARLRKHARRLTKEGE